MKKIIIGMAIMLTVLLAGCSTSTQEHQALHENIATIIQNQEIMNKNLQIVVDNQVIERENMKIMQENILNNCKVR